MCFHTRGGGRTRIMICYQTDGPITGEREGGGRRSLKPASYSKPNHRIVVFAHSDNGFLNSQWHYFAIHLHALFWVLSTFPLIIIERIFLVFLPLPTSLCTAAPPLKKIGLTIVIYHW